MTMAITSVLLFLVSRELWHWSLAHAGAVSGASAVDSLVVVDAPVDSPGLTFAPRAGLGKRMLSSLCS